MPVDLPEYVSVPLGRSPLVLVAAQINFEEIGREVTHAQARSVQKLVSPDWIQLQSAPLVEATMTPSGAVNEPNRQAYRLLTADGSWSLLLNRDSATIETRAYPGWAEFHTRIEELASAVAQVFDPATEQRLGLRYVDQIPLPDGRTDWKGLVPDALLGVSLDPRFAGRVLASDQRLLLQLDGDVRCVFRHGLLADADGRLGASYLLDYDVYRENRGYEAAGTAAGADDLHDYVGRLFRACLSDELYEWLRG